MSFFNSADPMVSDINHLYPTDNVPNNERSNYPFGTVVANITWELGGSKLGRNSQNQIVFEPRDVHKGNVARSLLYFVVRYDSNYGGFLSQLQEFWFRRWNWQDTVDAHERQRNNSIFSFQHKRNPFIDHPEFIDRISKFYGTATTTFAPEIFVSEDSINFGNASVGDTIERKIVIVNSGNANLTISSLHLNSNNFRIKQNVANVFPDSFANVIVQFIPSQTNQQFSDTLVITNNDADEGTVSISLVGNSVSTSISDIENREIKFSLSQNYPNPFNPITLIRYSISTKSNVTLKVYDILGKEIATLLNNEEVEQGEHNISFDATNLRSGIYFYKIAVEKNGVSFYTNTKKLVLVK